MGKWSRDKGAGFEREIARRFRAAGWIDAERCLEECRAGNKGDIDHAKPFTVQAKCGAAPSVWQAMREAMIAADPGDYPVAVLKRDRTIPLAVLTLDDFMELVGKLRTFGIL